MGFDDLAREGGLNPDAMLRQSGLNPRHLVDPDTPISALAVRHLLESSAAVSGIEDFGLRLARTRRLSNLGPLSVLMREAQTAREAIDSLCRYMRLVNASLLTTVEEHDDWSVVRLEVVLTEAHGSVRQVTELSMGVLYRSIAELLGPSWKPRSVCLEHRPPHGPTIHKTMFGGTVEFNADFNGIVCATHLLSSPLPPSDSRMALYARRILDNALSSAGEGSAHNARRTIIAFLPTGRCTADQVAKTLGMDRRTLHRHLLAEGTNFSLLLRTVRSEFASRHLIDSDRSLAEVADLLGFSTPSAFGFWFRKNFGMTASMWKQCQGRGAPRVGPE
ncbi:AraC family transcriptional regulator [Pseudomonas sp. Leaf48]|uniref:AraC family transcriptional regulator n=1 Tax=Pseudomonas sp. Leaf48 TaxID=1736221 RepID=UPI00191BF2DD|nr:AraC family transcriptional regulator [Pseudomonas sp. Leaf48]